jgi:hypothetical protein
MRVAIRLLVVSASLFGLVGPGSPLEVLADQTLSASIPYTSVHDPQLLKASREPRQIRRQLSTAQDYGHRALAGLQAAPVDDGVPLDAQAVLASRNAYVLIRAAHQGLETLREKQRVSDPTIELAFSRLTNAWNLSRTPVDKLSWAMTRQEYLAMSVRDLGQALRLVDQVLVLLP